MFRPVLVLFLCAAVLLSGCVTMTIATAKPERDSTKESFLQMVGVIGDGLIAGLATIVLYEAGFEPVDPDDVSLDNFIAGVLFTCIILESLIVVSDILLSNLVPREEDKQEGGAAEEDEAAE